MSLREHLDEDLKTAMRARDKKRVGVYRLIFSDIRKKEIDSRKTMEDTEILSVLEKMIKQRKDSINQFEKASRADLVAVEQAELVIIQAYLPTPFTTAEITTIIDEVINDLQKTAPQTLGPAMMGSVMNTIRPKLAGRADMGAVSAIVKKLLTPSS